MEVARAEVRRRLAPDMVGCMRIPKLLAIAAALTLLAGCSDTESTPTSPDGQSATEAGGSTAAPMTDADQSTSSGSDDMAGSSAAPTSDNSGALAALQKAADAVSGEPFDMESDIRDGRDVWDVKVAVNGQEYELWISADGSEVVDQEQHGSPDDDVQKVGQAQTTALDALTAATQQHNGLLDEMEIDTDSGSVVWQIELDQPDGTSIELTVDATNGAVTVDED